MFFLLHTLVMTVLTMAICASGALAAPAVPIEIEAPGRAFKGEAFPVIVTSRLPIEDVTITWLDREVPAKVSEEGGLRKAMVLLGTDVKRTYRTTETIEVRAMVDGLRSVQDKAVQIYEKDFPVQRLSVDPNMVQPPKEFWPRIEEEGRIVGKTLATITAERFWSQSMQRPTPGRISSIYGLKRVFNDQPRTPHRGIDIAAPQGESVLAAENGMVILTGDHYYAGQSVYLDHGQGVISVYMHLSRILVQPGQMVLRGEAIGHVGSTGRVTGPHLHFGLYVLGQAVDPEPLLGMVLADEAG